jgi:hypothetical protein
MKQVRAPEDIIRAKVIENPLVSEEEFQQAQKIILAKQGAVRRESGSGERIFQFNGFLFCGLCGSVMYEVRGGGSQEKAYYTCRRHSHPDKDGSKCTAPNVRAHELEHHVDSVLQNQLTSPEFIQKVIDQVEARRDDADLLIRPV